MFLLGPSRSRESRDQSQAQLPLGLKPWTDAQTSQATKLPSYQGHLWAVSIQVCCQAAV